MFRSLIATVLVLGLTSSVYASNKEYYKIKRVTVTEVTDDSGDSEEVPFAQNSGVASDCSSLSTTFDFSALDSISVDQIINIGKAVWQVVDAGKPVVTKNFSGASALPRGVSCWTDLSGWRQPISKVYSVQYENFYGVKVVDFKYRIIYMVGGSIDGVGKYITNASFVVAKLNVAWGFKFDAKAEVPAVFNMGTKANPIAGMQMNMHWEVDSPVAHEEETQSYFLSGDGSLSRMN